MTFQVIDHPSSSQRREIPQSVLLNLISQYEDCSRKLEAIAESVPTTLEEAEQLDRRESLLHDQRAELLGEVISHDPQSLDDVKALLKLWHIEKVVEQPKGSVTVTDGLVLKICEFLDVA